MRQIPSDWIEGIASLDPERPPSDVPRHRWRLFVSDCCSTVSIGPGSSGNTIIAGNGAGDSFTGGNFNTGNTGNTIIFGNGDGDTVSEGIADNETIILGNGAGDKVTLASGFVGGALGDKVTLGDGNNDQVILLNNGLVNTVTLGDGNNDIVFSAGGSVLSTGGSRSGNIITVGNGNDIIHVGQNDMVKVGTGQDVFAFDWNPFLAAPPLNQGPDQSSPGGIGNVTITGFDPSKDVIVLQQALATDFSHLTFQPVGGNALVTINGDTLDQITLVGVPPSALHQSDFQFV